MSFLGEVENISCDFVGSIGFLELGIMAQL
jgi:hypothetical protein